MEEPESAKPEDEFSDIPGPPRNPYVTLALGLAFGMFIGGMLVLWLTPRFTPSIEGRGIVTTSDNGNLIISNVRLEIDGVDADIPAGYIVEFEGSMLRLRLGWKQAENWWQRPIG